MPRIVDSMKRTLLLLHRYLGIGLGALISLWCLSGFVMLYVQYPEWGPSRQLAGLEALDVSDCCRIDASALSADRYRRAIVEAHGGTPVAILFDARGQRSTVDLVSGERIDRVSRGEAQRISQSFVRALGLQGHARWLGTIERDQWTVSGEFDADRPLLKFGAGDPAGTQWYVSSTTGRVVQATTSRQRFWNWIGSVVHWLYPTLLRQHAAVWAQVVIWTSLLGGFLTLVGLYIGLLQYRRRRNGRRSPYRGWALWHHYAGLIFGVLLLTWLVSGTFSMTPWPFLQSRGFGAEIQRLQGGDLRAGQLRALPGRLSERVLPAGLRRLELIVEDGQPYWLAWAEEPRGVSRLSAERFTPAPLAASDLRSAASRMRPGTAVRSSGFIDEPDAYYFSHHDERPLPVYRIVYADGERFYLDADTGRLRLAVDQGQKAYRWLFDALHRGDFAALLRRRPWWDLLMLVLLTGVTVSALTGTWMGCKRLMGRPRRGSPGRLRREDVES